MDLGGLLIPSRKAEPAPAVSLRVAMKNALSGNWKGTEPRGQSLKPHIQPSLLEVDGLCHMAKLKDEKKKGRALEVWKVTNCKQFCDRLY